MSEWNHSLALLRAAQCTFDNWRHDPKRGPLDRAITRMMESHEYADTIVSDKDRLAFRKIIFAIKANQGHGYTNPRRLLDIIETVLGPDDQFGIVRVQAAQIKR